MPRLSALLALACALLAAPAIAQVPPKKATRPPPATKPAAPAKPVEEESIKMQGVDLDDPPAAAAPVQTRTIEAVSDVKAEPVGPAEVSAKLEKPDGKVGLTVGAKVALLVPSGRTTDVKVDLSDASPGSVKDASHSATVAFSLALTWGLPFLERALSIRGEAGYYPLSGKGTRDYPNDPDFGSMSYSYKSRSIPLLIGLGYRLPLGLPVEIAPVAGFVAVHSTFTSSWSQGGVTTETMPVSAWAKGFYGGAEAALALGPGVLTGEVRYMNARTDLGLTGVKEYGGAYNKELGDVQGMNVLFGYRFEF